MHCRSCDRPLSDLEAVTKNLEGQYEDMCQRCLDEDAFALAQDEFNLEEENLSQHPETLFHPLAEESDNDN